MEQNLLSNIFKGASRLGSFVGSLSHVSNKDPIRTTGILLSATFSLIAGLYSDFFAMKKPKDILQHTL